MTTTTMTVVTIMIITKLHLKDCLISSGDFRVIVCIFFGVNFSKKDNYKTNNSYTTIILLSSIVRIFAYVTRTA
jgi:hypothetical protein